ncbi:MAG: RNA polymerase-binding transcription factor DksA [Halocynthiibacter sp.]|jgi:RNA polymerase-binding transcription factor DksA
MSHLAKRKSTLLARLGELDRRAHKLDDALDAPKSKDWEESAVEREGDEVMEQMGSAALAEMEGIRAALARFDSGSYGACVDCGAEISSKRLDLLPATPFCKDCAAKHAH